MALAVGSVQETRLREQVDRHAALLILAGSLLIGFTLRVWLALSDHGLVHADEIYQSLEPAHSAVFGYGLTAWEFMAGGRNWTFPGLLAGVLAFLSLIGLDSPSQYLTVIRLAFCAIGIATAFGIYQLARSIGAGAVAAACAAALFALTGIFIYFAPRAMSDLASALPLVFGMALVLRKDARPGHLSLGGSLLGLAVLIRLQSAFFCLGVLALLLIRGQRRAAATTFGVLLIWAFLYGLIDKLTWGQWFRSVIVYLRFNLIDDGAAIYGTHEPLFYPVVLFSSMGLVVLLLGALGLLAARRALGLTAIVAFSIVAYWFVPHKELRFLLPSLALWCAVAGVGIQQLMDSWRSRLASMTPWAVVVAALVSAATFPSLTFENIGYFEPGRARLSALDFHGSENRLLLAAYQQPDLCGLQVQTTPLWRTGGFTYLHRPVPLYGPGGRLDSGHFNYVIAPRDAVTGEEVASDADLVLVRLPITDCAEDLSYSWGL